MSEIHKSVTIDAPAEKIYGFVDNPENFSKYVPNVERVVDIKRSEGRIGDSFRVIYKVMGVTFDEKFTVTEHQPPHKAGSRFEGGMKGTFDWSFEPPRPADQDHRGRSLRIGRWRAGQGDRRTGSGANQRKGDRRHAPEHAPRPRAGKGVEQLAARE